MTCKSCGDVKSCGHRPSDVITRIPTIWDGKQWVHADDVPEQEG